MRLILAAAGLATVLGFLVVQAALMYGHLLRAMLAPLGRI